MSTRELSSAHELLRRGQLQQADAACRQVLAARPNDPDALQLLALVRKQGGDLDTAERLMRSSVALAPARADFHANLGNLLRTRGQVADAELAYRSALQIDPSLRNARLGLARLLNDAGMHAHAESEARRLIQSNARDAEAWSALGVALRGQDQAAAAEAAYRKALEIQPGYAVARHNLGALLSQQQRAEEALAELDRAAAAGARGREISFNRGRALADLSRFEEAELAFEAALAVDPAHVESHVALAKLRYMRGDAQFTRSFALGERARPGDLRLGLAHGDLLRMAGNPAAAESLLRGMRQVHPQSPEAASALAIVLHEQGRLEEALLEGRRAFDALPDHPGASETLLGVLLSLGIGAEALRIARRQRELAPWTSAGSRTRPPRCACSTIPAIARSTTTSASCAHSSSSHRPAGRASRPSTPISRPSWSSATGCRRTRWTRACGWEPRRRAACSWTATP
jgi:Flp pilus assembly protein TadD